MFYRAIFLVLLLTLGPSCSSTSGSNSSTRVFSSPTPVLETERPAEWKRIEIRSLSFEVPPDLKAKNVRGIDSFISSYEGREFTLDVEMGIYSGRWPTYHSFEYETGTLMVNGRPIRFIKEDTNKPAANAARNADGSTSKPLEKHLSVTVYIPENEATISVSYAEENLTPGALSILQSLRIKD